MLLSSLRMAVLVFLLVMFVPKALVGSLCTRLESGLAWLPLFSFLCSTTPGFVGPLRGVTDVWACCRNWVRLMCAQAGNYYYFLCGHVNLASRLFNQAQIDWLKLYTNEH